MIAKQMVQAQFWEYSVDGVYFERYTVENLKMSSRKQTVDVTKIVANHTIARISK